jgi:hypothetical protein
MPWWDVWTTKSKDFVYAEIPVDKTSTGLGRTPLVPKAGYIRIFLKTWRIDNIREGWKGFYGAVHGSISTPRVGGGTVDVDAFTSPNQLQNADPKHANRIISTNFPVFGPVPYVGGDLDLKIGLFSIKSADLSGPFIDVLSTIAGAAGGGAYVAAAKPFIDPLKKGIEALTGTANDTRLEIGLVRTYNAPTSGYFAVVRADASQIDKSKLRIDNDEHLVNDSDGTPIKDYPYFVFTIESTTQHDTWYDIPDLQQPYAELKTIVDDDRSTPAILKSAYSRFRKKVKLSPYLIPVDTERVLAEVKKLIAEVTGVDVSEAEPKPSGKGGSSSILSTPIKFTSIRNVGLVDALNLKGSTGATGGKSIRSTAKRVVISRLPAKKAAKKKQGEISLQSSGRKKMPPLKGVKIYASGTKSRA